MKTASGTQDSTCKQTPILKPLSPPLNLTTNRDGSNISLLEELKSVHDLIKTTTKSVTCMLPQSSTIEFPNALSLKLGTSKKETVIISYHGTVIYLTPDGETTISKSSAKSTKDNVLYLSWENYQKTSNANVLIPRKKKRKKRVDDVLMDMRDMLTQGNDEEAFKKYPRTFIQYGEKLKALISQKKDQLTSEGHPHIWLHGYPGTGKSAILSYIYPNTYKKNLYNKFFDLYDPKVHDHIMLEDLDHDAVDKLSTNFLKTLCDESGFAIDQKYKTPQLTRSTILVSSNFTISQIISQSEECNVFGKESNKTALLRRFWEVNALEFLRILGVKLIPKWEIAQLKKAGNTDCSKLFLCYDYLRDAPTGKPLKTPEEYQKIIKDHYYA